MFIICKCIYKFIWRFLERCLVITLSMICHWHGTPWFTMASRYKLNKHVTRRGGKGPQGPHSHILMTGESEGFFWVWHFGQKGFFWVYERRRDFFGSRNNTGIFFGYCIFHRLKVSCDMMMKDPTALPKYFWCAVSHQQGDEQNMSSQSTSSVTV